MVEQVQANFYAGHLFVIGGKRKKAIPSEDFRSNAIGAVFTCVF
jgi:hypothetical protein